MLIDYCNFILSEEGLDPTARQSFERAFLPADLDQSVLCELASVRLRAHRPLPTRPPLAPGDG
jgi:hypothetical protein